MIISDWLRELTLPGAVVPVLVGPLQTLLALLPAILLGLATFLLAIFTPTGCRRVLRFFWRQKVFTLVLAAIGVAILTLWPQAQSTGDPLVWGTSPTITNSSWPSFHGDGQRSGRGPSEHDPAVGVTNWHSASDSAVYSSAAIAGDLVIYSTASDIGPFNPAGRGAIVALDALTGLERWRYAPADYRATFSSPVVSDGYVVCGEGLHLVQDARVTCLDMSGRLQWEFRTKSHVESTPAIADGRVFVGAGDDGFYCLDLHGDGRGQPRVLWQLSSEFFADCESSPVVADGSVYFGLGENGQAICCADAATGELKWRLHTPHPVFAAPTWVPASDTAGPKLLIAMGNGNLVQSAQEVRDQRLAAMQAAGASAEQLAEAERKLAPAGQVWCIDVKTREVDWRYLTGDTILGAIAFDHGRLYFGCRDGTLHCLTLAGNIVQRTNLHDPIVASPAIGKNHVFVATAGGRVISCDSISLLPEWESSLGTGETFTSSPVLAHGHVYIGSQRDGLCCLGAAASIERTVWTRGELGGAADRDPLPDTVAVASQWPPGDERFEIVAPLTVADGQLYAVGTSPIGHRLVRLDLEAQNGNAARPVWEAICAPMDGLPPVVVGTNIITIERFTRFGRPQVAADADAAGPTSMPFLLCRNVQDGQMTWRMHLRPGGLRRWTCDLQRAYVLAVDGIVVFTSREGAPIWGTNFPADESAWIEPVGDILLTSRDNHWFALDGASGVPLWYAEEPSAAVRLLDARDTHFISYVVPNQRGPLLQLRRVLDGRLIWQTAWKLAAPPRWARLSAEHAHIGNDQTWQVLRLEDGSAIEFSEPAADGADPARGAKASEPTGAGIGSGLTGVMRSGPLLVRSRVFDPGSGDALQMIDVDRRDSRSWLSLHEVGTPITPLVAARSRLYFGTDRGKIVCVAAPRSP